MNYREATQSDAKTIALLHAKSWQENYRGIWQDSFLDHDVVEDRLKIWEQRLQNPKPNQYIFLTEGAGLIMGFVCIYTHEDATWGTLVDNLHIAKDFKGQGIGKQLLKKAAQWSYQHDPNAKLYLWVLEKNMDARNFYEKLGGVNAETVLVENPDQTFSESCRYVWHDVQQLL